MKKDKNRPSIDGISLRRRQPLEGASFTSTYSLRSQSERANAQESGAPEILPRPQAIHSGGLRRSDIDASLTAVDMPNSKQTGVRRKRHIFTKKRIAALIVLLLIGVIAYFGVRWIMAASQIFNGNVFDLLGSGQALKEDKNGRTNILIFGTSEGDAGHQGAALTDSMMVISLDQDKKVASMVSMPRDLWVKYDTDCQFGYQGKINVVYQCAGAVDGDINNIDVATGSQALQNKVGEVFGMDVQYYVKVNYSVVRDVTTALGGVTVNVESDDPRGMYDINTNLKLPNGPATLQGEQALAFVRARGDGGGYGFVGSNFVREQNQQKMVVAIRDKALSAGTLSNPVAVDGLVNSLGNNIRTNFTAAEVKTLVSLAQHVPADGITNISLVDDQNPVVTTGSYNLQSIVRPIAGIMDYSDIQVYIREQIDGGSVSSENATIAVLNGSETVGAAAAKQTELLEAGFLNISVGDSVYTPDASLVWYDRSESKKPKTAEQLAVTLGKPSAGTDLPNGVQSDADFVIILGN